MRQLGRTSSVSTRSEDSERTNYRNESEHRQAAKENARLRPADEYDGEDEESLAVSAEEQDPDPRRTTGSG